MMRNWRELLQTRCRQLGIGRKDENTDDSSKMAAKKRRFLLGLLRDEKGTAAIELGMVGSVLFLMGLGLDDFGVGYWERIQVGNAARAGGEYAIKNGWDQSGITSAVTSATGLSSIEASPAPAKSCGCPSATSGITAANCGSSCPGAGTAGAYVTINAQHTYSTIFTYPGVANPLSLSARVIVRIN